MLGFHLEGLIISILAVLPNLMFVVFPPNNLPKGNIEKPHMLFQLLEKLGQGGIMAIPLLFGLSFSGVTGKIALVGMIITLCFYYYCWFRYFKCGNDFRLLFTPIFGIPIPMAFSPIMYFAFTALAMRSLTMTIAVLSFALGHLVVSKTTAAYVKNNS
ncbi:hypothetical protein FRZ06_02990 [Anoxybacterium hadale]|uniref:Uncharacterized protein n=1 Tax=Anoxybacterium hadale TaxID=3408580 RepID=A0ACD1A7I3_9FIRM|nr:hypothetical protein FRZ06_02990 [Clostridiales bacterium]